MRYIERKASKRISYLQSLRTVVKERTSKNIIYIDESGFSSNTHREYGWKAKGVKVYGERSGNSRPRTSLIAGKRGKELLAPVL